MSVNILMQGNHGITERNIEQARAIHAKVSGGSGVAVPMGIWSHGCYFVEDEKGEVHAYGRNWRKVACVA